MTAQLARWEPKLLDVSSAASTEGVSRGANGKRSLSPRLCSFSRDARNSNNGYGTRSIPLVAAIEVLFDQQRDAWPTFRQGEAALEHLVVRELMVGDARIYVQANPARRRSSEAQVDAASIAQRPCFLCPENMPAEERGIAWGELVILPNPYPILRRHCTVPLREHLPQRLSGRAGQLLRLAGDLGDSLVAFYNGPRCGASAPDHLHFQICDAAAVPLWNEIPWPSPGALWKAAKSSCGRNVLAASAPELAPLEAMLEETLEVLADLTSVPQAGCEDPDAEPMLNVLSGWSDGHYRCLAFPRAAHRPRCYFAEPPERLALSPAALEMAGVLVASFAEDLPRIDEGVIESIYREVSLGGDQFTELAARLGCAF